MYKEFRTAALAISSLFSSSMTVSNFWLCLMRLFPAKYTLFVAAMVFLRALLYSETSGALAFRGDSVLKSYYYAGIFSVLNFKNFGLSPTIDFSFPDL